MDNEAYADFTIENPFGESQGYEIEPADSPETEHYRKQEQLPELGAGEGRKPSFAIDPSGGSDSPFEDGDALAAESNFSKLEQLIQRNNAAREQGSAEVRELAKYQSKTDNEPT